MEDAFGANGVLTLLKFMMALLKAQSIAIHVTRMFFLAMVENTWKQVLATN